MCQDIMFGNSTASEDYDISSIGQLKAAYGPWIHEGDLPNREGGYEHFDEDKFCLCGVEIGAILERAGVEYAVGFFGFEVETFTPLTPPEPDPAFED